jgi:hypothetical protein
MFASLGGPRGKERSATGACQPAAAGEVSHGIIEAHNLHLRFGDCVALENVSLTFEAGRLSGIMGPTAPAKPPASTC